MQYCLVPFVLSILFLSQIIDVECTGSFRNSVNILAAILDERLKPPPPPVAAAAAAPSTSRIKEPDKPGSVRVPDPSPASTSDDVIILPNVEKSSASSEAGRVKPNKVADARTRDSIDVVDMDISIDEEVDNGEASGSLSPSIYALVNFVKNRGHTYHETLFRIWLIRSVWSFDELFMCVFRKNLQSGVNSAQMQ